MWSIKFKAWFNSVGCKTVTESGFDATLSANKATVLDFIRAGKRAQSKALGKRYPGSKRLDSGI